MAMRRSLEADPQDQGSEGEVTISDAAARLGVHKNTIRHRIKSGRYRARKVETHLGLQYLIDPASLENETPGRSATRTRPATLPSTSEIERSQDRPPTTGDRFVETMLATFVDRLEASNRLVSQLEQERDIVNHVRQEEAETAAGRIAELEARVRELEALLERMRQRYTRR
jgi:excisionase family DNA binding protein